MQIISDNFPTRKKASKDNYRDGIEIKEILIFKGVAFDEFTQDEYGTYGEICEECLNKYPQFKDNVESTKTAICCCSVMGCENTVEGSDEGHYYIDFDKQPVKPSRTTHEERKEN